jgi:hypothetical protein
MEPDPAEPDPAEPDPAEPDPAEADLAESEVPRAASAPAASAPLPLADDGFALVVGELASLAPETGGGVMPEADGLPEAEESDCVFSRPPEESGDEASGDEASGDEASADEASGDFDEEPSASAAVSWEDLSFGSEDLSLPSGVSPFLLSDSGLGSTLFRTTVSG